MFEVWVKSPYVSNPVSWQVSHIHICLARDHDPATLIRWAGGMEREECSG